MEDQAYQELCKKLAKRGGRFPGMDIPEFYDLAKELFTPEEATVFNAIPKEYHTKCKFGLVYRLWGLRHGMP